MEVFCILYLHLPLKKKLFVLPMKIFKVNDTVVLIKSTNVMKGIFVAYFLKKRDTLQNNISNMYIRILAITDLPPNICYL